MSGPLTKVVIAGRHAPLWLAAGVLARALKDAGVTVEAVELPSTLTIADIYPTQPALEALHNQLGIGEAMLLKGTRGSFALGQHFTDSVAGTPGFLLAHGSFGAAIDGADFFAYWLKARRHGLGVGLEDFSLTASAARHGRLMLPDEETEIYGRADYGYHLPAQAYAGLLKAVAIHNGVTVHEAASLTAERDEAGNVTALKLDGDRRIAGELFVDTGAGIADGAWQNWWGYFPANRLFHAAAPRLSSLPAYAEIRAGANGWAGIYPTRAATHVTYAFTGDHFPAIEDAKALTGLDLTPFAVRPIDQGCREQPWAGNVVALGEAAARFDPVHGVDLHALQIGLVQLLASFPASASYAAQRAEYNRVTASSYARIRDFQSAHYALNRYGSSFFWSAPRTVSPELDQRIDFFRARGEIAPWEEESFAPDSWRALFSGHGVTPETWLPLIDRTSPDVMKAQFRRMLGFVKEQVLRQPTHDAYLERLDG